MNDYEFRKQKNLSETVEQIKSVVKDKTAK